MNTAVRVKLDENLGSRDAAMLRAAGYDVATVFEQDLASASDTALIQACRDEDRCLITLDRGFGNPFLFRPTQYAGIVVLRLSSQVTADELRQAVE